MESFTEAWSFICDYCKKHITEVAYTTWISRIEPVSLDFAKGIALLKAPNEFHRQTLNRCYMDLLNDAVAEIFGPGIQVQICVPEEMNIVYIKGDEFTNELIEAIRHGTTAEFHQRYRKADVFLVDDIQFIAGKESTQEEFFHTFNTLYEAKKQIVLTSDRPPKDIATLEERLLTRFEWGLTADIQPPDFETRIAIIKRKAELLGINLPNNVIEYIANRLKNNIRQLEGTVKKMKAYYLLNGDSLTLTTAQMAVSDIINNEQPVPVTVEKIIEEVARTYGASPEDIRSSKRSANISNARQVAMYIVREITQMPMTSIGEEFGGRDHSTVVYAIQQVEKGMARDPKTKGTVEDIIKNIRDR